MRIWRHWSICICCVTFRYAQILTSLTSKNFCFLRRFCICHLYCCGKSVLPLRPVVKYRYFSAQWPKRLFSPFFENLVEQTRTKREKRIATDSIQRPPGTERRRSYKKCRYTFRYRAKEFYDAFHLSGFRNVCWKWQTHSTVSFNRRLTGYLTVHCLI
jgi:hypothetical protein